MLRWALAAWLPLAGAGCRSEPVAPPPREPDFQDELAQSGEWIVVAPYGRVWHPHRRIVGQGFAPYLTGGEWKYGEDGWTFETKWPWAKIAYHHGRWFFADDLDWLWVPDTVWGPAWVDWRFGGGFVAWSPLAPVAKTARARPAPWFWVKTRFFTQGGLERNLLSREEAAKAEEVAPPLAATAESYKAGPPADAVRAEGGGDVSAGPPDAGPPPAATKKHGNKKKKKSRP